MMAVRNSIEFSCLAWSSAGEAIATGSPYGLAG